MIKCCPFDKALIDRFRNETLVIRYDAFSEIIAVANAVNENNRLHCIMINYPKKLDSLTIYEEYADIPIALYTPGIGEISDFIKKIKMFRKLNIRVFLPESDSETFSGLRILSSLGIACGIVFDRKNPDWESVNDLMHYAVYGMVSRGQIEPFGYLLLNYERGKYIDYGAVYFNDPERYFHISSFGILSLFHERLLSREDFFLKPEGCAYCQGWRICLGKFPDSSNQKYGCQKLFVDVLEAAEYYYKKRTSDSNQLWQL
ncbi:MAG: hypothetical protein HQK88_09965 [Nitrospirae bacterium]|nr:hypothetical protein [Nitrospirota bacterium]MBF0534496.1 hypothetical protein [Nitrospirota bacterium]MBF0617122.1 hypothetical protein [Nitrospirota bacterium]